MHYSKNSELKIALLLVNIIVNTECQHSQNSAVGLYKEIYDTLQLIGYSRSLIAQDKLFHRRNAVRIFLIPST